MIYFWAFIVAALGSGSYLFHLIYMKKLHDGTDVTQAKILGTLSMFLAIIIFLFLIMMEI
ncbi:hypothetical protein [Sporosarcina sp. HYO08]|uniref:hypothetical protein n=1 Tax=Sporosarcina sp. HYO08 TaxID=1759557 RepID=UPI000799CC7C|nr:hypothetical protein [Sporosarcina sp. HYO08]KXH83755.1 hypothetical protein AU377_03025 [Sporosarcina sp. HYO08]